MAITARQLENRAKGFGASEIGALLGVDPYRTPGDVLLRKRGVGPVEHEESELAEIGTLMEIPVSKLAERRLGVKLVKPTATYWSDNGVLFANPDRQIEKPSRGSAPVEIKDTGIMEGWGEPGSDEVPDRVMLQVQAQMICTASDFAHVAAMLYPFGRRELRIYRIGRNEKLCKIITDRTSEMWERYILNGESIPAAIAPGRETLSYLTRDPGKAISIPADLVAAWRDAAARKKEAEEAEEAAKNAVRAALAQAGAEIGECELGVVTEKEQSRVGVDTERLEKEHPEVFKALRKVTTFRVMRFTKPKGGAK